MKILRLFGRAVVAWWNDDAMRLGASVAYYSLFAIAPILLVAIAVAGTIFGGENVRGEIVAQIDRMIGREGATAVQALLEGASKPRENLIATIVGAAAFITAACGVFLELQASLNTIWGVERRPGANVFSFLFNRLQSFGLVVAIGFLLMVSLAVSAAVAAVGHWVGGWAPLLPVLLQAAQLLLSLVVTAVLFGLLFKVLPDVQLSWRDVAAGGAVTALLFAVGKELIGLYLGRSSTASSYGAAGSVVVLLLWVYYSSQIVLLGAEFTRLYAERRAPAGGRLASHPADGPRRGGSSRH